jgi:hypothetical protein
MTIPEMKEIIAQTDAAIAAQNRPATIGEAHSITAVEIETVITIGITVLTAVKALLWWKPSWQSAVGNVISYLETFETIATAATPTTTAS